MTWRARPEAFNSVDAGRVQSDANVAGFPNPSTGFCPGRLPVRLGGYMTLGKESRNLTLNGINPLGSDQLCCGKDAGGAWKIVGMIGGK